MLMEVSLEGYVLEILTGYLWVSGMGEVIQECLKEKGKDFLKSRATFILKKG